MSFMSSVTSVSLQTLTLWQIGNGARFIVTSLLTNLPALPRLRLISTEIDPLEQIVLFKLLYSSFRSSCLALPLAAVYLVDGRF